MRNFLFIVLAATTFSACASPCDGVDRSLTKERKAALAPAIAKQLNVPSVDVLQSFRIGEWSIVNVAPYQMEKAYLFYSRDPITSRYITLWGGVALASEEQAIKDWTTKNAPGIPPKIAKCFAWHVTKDR